MATAVIFAILIGGLFYLASDAEIEPNDSESYANGKGRPEWAYRHYRRKK